MKRTLSPRDLAAAIGVSESSLKRWADQGAVRVTRTAGGHRRIAVPDAIDFIRASRLQLVQPEVLGLSDLAPIVGDVPRESEEASRFLEYLVEGRSGEARGLVLWMFLNGKSVAQICDGPLRGAMQHLGETWADRPDGILLEHRATDLCIQALNQVRATREIVRGVAAAVGGAPSGDPYLLPTLAVATALATEGFHAINVGPETPVQSLLEAARIYRPAFVWLSITSEQESGILREYVRELANGLLDRDLSLMVGGRAARGLGVLPLSNVHRGDSIGELVAFAKGLSRSRPGASSGS